MEVISWLYIKSKNIIKILNKSQLSFKKKCIFRNENKSYTIDAREVAPGNSYKEMFVKNTDKALFGKLIIIFWTSSFFNLNFEK